MNETKNICGESLLRFADIEILRYEVPHFEQLPLRRKLLIYHLSEASIAGRDITFDQNGKYNLRLRHICECIYQYYREASHTDEWNGFVEYLRRLWFSSGIHHHYGSEKFVPSFSEHFWRKAISHLQNEYALLLEYDSRAIDELCRVVFDPKVLPKRTEQSGSNDLIDASSVNFYDNGIKQADVEAFYQAQNQSTSAEEKKEPLSYGLNSRIAQTLDGTLYEQTYHIKGLYGQALEAISTHLKAALSYTESPAQKEAILCLLSYYKTGHLEEYNNFCIKWVQDTDIKVDFINGFTEVYSDPLGLKGTWEGLVHLKNEEASTRSQKICSEALWFEQNAPIDERFKKSKVVGVTATAVDVAMLGGDCYPATPIGVNLPNADWIRASYGSKSITISNIHQAYHTASKYNGMDKAFIADENIQALLAKYDQITDELHTDLHECLGHGSGQLLPGVSPDALGPYSSVIEETRADLFALYYMGDNKMLSLGLLPDAEAYKAGYYRYLLNGLVTQLTRVHLGADLEEAHMRNRALIARYALERGQAEGTISLQGLRLEIKDFLALRSYFAELLQEVQRIKSEGDLLAGKTLIENYAIKIDQKLHAEVLRIYHSLNLAPYRGFVNPRYDLIWHKGSIIDVQPNYTETYDEQMLRYSRDYSHLPLNPSLEELTRNPQPSKNTLEISKQLRSNLRGSMDGIISNSMREKGLHYYINFGLTMEHIQSRAKGLKPSADLARYLYSRDVRELKLIAQLIYPAEDLDFSEACHWAEKSFPNPELRDCLCKHLFDRCKSAPQWAFAWLMCKDKYHDIHAIAYTILARHFTHGYSLPSPHQETKLLSLAFDLLNNVEDYISADHKAALLMLKRWGRCQERLRQVILTHPILSSWHTSKSCILTEFADDICFELNYNHN